MKKILYFLCIVLFSTTAYAASDTNNATLNNAQVRFNNGKIQTIQCYNINGYNFVRVRDITNNLGMAVYAIQHDVKGVVVDPYDIPASREPLEKLTQQIAKVKVEKGELIYDGSINEAECFLLNGRYYFKLADLEKATNKALGSIIINLENDIREILHENYVFDKFRRIDITWNDSAKIIDVNIIETDIQKIVSNFLKGTKARDGYKVESYNLDTDFICIQQRGNFTYIVNEFDVNLLIDKLISLLNQGEIVESAEENILKQTANFVYRIILITNEEIKVFDIYKSGTVFEHIYSSKGIELVVPNTELDDFVKIVDVLYENSYRYGA